MKKRDTPRVPDSNLIPPERRARIEAVLQELQDDRCPVCDHIPHAAIVRVHTPEETAAAREYVRECMEASDDGDE